MFAIPSHSVTNGLVERLNKTLAAVISAYINVSHDDWDEKAHLLDFAINPLAPCSPNRIKFALQFRPPPRIFPFESSSTSGLP